MVKLVFPNFFKIFLFGFFFTSQSLRIYDIFFITIARHPPEVSESLNEQLCSYSFKRNFEKENFKIECPESRTGRALGQ